MGKAQSTSMNAETVNAYQKTSGVHPLTCGNCTEPYRTTKPLVAVDEDGKVVLYCPICEDYRQEMTEHLLDVVTRMYEAVGNSRR